MHIKQQFLAQHLKKTPPVPIYVLIGQDTYLTNEAVHTLKSFFACDSECRSGPSPDFDLNVGPGARPTFEMTWENEKKCSVTATEDWHDVIEEANSDSLFSEHTLLHVSFDKKTIDNTGKKALSNYLSTPNPRCTLIILAPLLQAKNINWLSAQNQVLVVMSYPLDEAAMKRWINVQLQSHYDHLPAQATDLIYYHTQGNMLAAAQTIEKLTLCHTPNAPITLEDIQKHLTDHSSHALFDLVDLLLDGTLEKSIHLLRKAAQNHTEPVLVLWIFTQELRTLLSLNLLLQQKVDIKTACSQLKIWPQRITRYQLCLKRCDRTLLEQLLQACLRIDERIKSNHPLLVWHALEHLSIALCRGEPCRL